eukprot:gb/GECG01001433.1/.p1 GENE.gb/GECG01001433.1/~~gb/GECG01001433.1/.p1  ORF type:complete len:143 (+),score=12.74 gb/GECG01001433.1/:1-429(+)
MRHRKFSRASAHRMAMFRNMATSLIHHERIKTTLHKAKDLRPIMDKLITKGKTDTLHKKRQVGAFVRDTDAVHKVFEQLAPRYQARPGGYTRVLRCGYRKGDNAPMAIIEFVDREGELRPARPASGADEMEAEAARDEVNDR